MLVAPASCTLSESYLSYFRYLQNQYFLIPGYIGCFQPWAKKVFKLYSLSIPWQEFTQLSMHNILLSKYDSVVNSENISHSLGHFPHWYFIDLVSVQYTKYSPKVWHKRCCFVQAPMLDCLLTSCVQTYLFCVCCVQRVYCLESILSWTFFLALIVYFLWLFRLHFHYLVRLECLDC